MMAEVGTMTRSATAGQAGARHGLVRLLPPLVGGLALLLALIGFIGTAIRDPRPNDVPVGVVGPDAAVRQLSTALGSAAPGAFRLTSYDSEAAARTALDSRAVDGVLLLGGGGRRPRALYVPATSKRSDSGGLDHSASAPLMAAARAGLARQAS